MSVPDYKKHGRRCSKCGKRTYRDEGVCTDCTTGKVWMAVEALPEDYLMRCAEELLKRHQARADALRRLGILEAA